MEINIDISKPSFTTYYYDGCVIKNDKKYCFEIKDAGGDLEINWLDEDLTEEEDIEDKIIEQYEKAWK